MFEKILGENVIDQFLQNNKTAAFVGTLVGNALERQRLWALLRAQVQHVEDTWQEVRDEMRRFSDRFDDIAGFERTHTHPHADSHTNPHAHAPKRSVSRKEPAVIDVGPPVKKSFAVQVVKGVGTAVLLAFAIGVAASLSGILLQTFVIFFLATRVFGIRVPKTSPAASSAGTTP